MKWIKIDLTFQSISLSSSQDVLYIPNNIQYIFLVQKSTCGSNHLQFMTSVLWENPSDQYFCIIYDVLVLLYNKGQGHLFLLRQIDFLLNFIERICIPSPNIVYRIPTSVNSDLQNQVLLNIFIWFCCIQWNCVYSDDASKYLESTQFKKYCILTKFGQDWTLNKKIFLSVCKVLAGLPS